MSRLDRAPTVAVDFSAPQTGKRTLPLAAIAIVALLAGVMAVAVTQLLLR